MRVFVFCYSPREFLDSVDHVRFLCWLFIGVLTHHAVAENVLSTKCQPLPLDDVNNISVIVMSIMTGFVEYSSASVEFMSSLFYGFILCQVIFSRRSARVFYQLFSV